MKKIADYDTVNYDYSTYWKSREYEHKSEILVLNKLFKGCSGKYILDIGGSYGRLLPTYYEKYKTPIIVDYSIKTLQKNYKDIKRRFPNAKLIAANAYHLPFRDSCLDVCLMVRVLHHIVKPTEYFNEAYRVIKPNGIYIQEFANKLHLKAVLRAIVKLDTSLFIKGPYQQPDRNRHEGSRKHVKVPFFNYSSKWIKQNLEQTGFVFEQKIGCSFFRLDFFKRNLSVSKLLKLENIFQRLFSFTNISPSIFLKLKAKKNKKESMFGSIEDILACPKCNGSLKIENEKAVCSKCKKEYVKKDNIWDFRI